MQKRPTTEQLLREELEDLFRRVEAERSLRRNPNETQQHIDMLDMRWTEVLEKERGLRLDQARKDSQHLVEQQELDANKRDRQLQDSAMKDLAEQNMRRPIFHVSKSREGLNPEFAEQRDSAAAQLFEPIETQINQRYDRLVSALQIATDNIREGKTPDLRSLLHEQEDHEAKLAKALDRIHGREPDDEREI